MLDHPASPHSGEPDAEFAKTLAPIRAESLALEQLSEEWMKKNAHLLGEITNQRIAEESLANDAAPIAAEIEAAQAEVDDQTAKSKEKRVADDISKTPFSGWRGFLMKAIVACVDYLIVSGYVFSIGFQGQQALVTAGVVSAFSFLSGYSIGHGVKRKTSDPGVGMQANMTIAIGVIGAVVITVGFVFVTMTETVQASRVLLSLLIVALTIFLSAALAFKSTFGLTSTTTTLRHLGQAQTRLNKAKKKGKLLDEGRGAAVKANGEAIKLDGARATMAAERLEQRRQRLDRTKAAAVESIVSVLVARGMDAATARTEAQRLVESASGDHDDITYVKEVLRLPAPDAV